MTTVDLPVPGRALAIGAHADDVELGAGATIARWAATGTEVHLLVCTDGSKGTWDRDADLVALVETRRREQRAAAERLGIASVVHLGVVDGELTADRETLERACEVVRRSRPDVVLAHDPWRVGRLHPDHLHAGRLAVDAVVAARDHHFFPHQAPPLHRAAELLLFEARPCDHVEVATPAALDAKVEALLCHRSQWRSTMGIGDAPELETARYARSVRAAAAAAGGRVGRAAGEAFRRIRLR